MRQKANAVCPGCGKAVESNWQFCPFCQIALTEQLCPGCNKAVQPDWKLCPFCGRRLGNKIAVPGEHDGVPSGAGNLADGFVEGLTRMKFILVAAGSFHMGDLHQDGAPDERPVHLVHLDEFYMAVYPVTQKQWGAVCKENPSRFRGEDVPVEQVTWKAARRFARNLNRLSQSGFSFDLPTEAQWEYAARSRGSDQRWAGNGPIEQLGWIAENSEGRPQPVGFKKPNGLGLYDMSGNVWEWCLDDYRSDAYELHDLKNPVLVSNGREKVLRGGAWHLDGWSARCARRFSLDAELTGAGVGLRLVAYKKS